METMNEAMDKYGDAGGSVVILSGGAKGVDTLAREIAHELDLDFVLFKPYHMLDPTVEYTPKYFFTRNKQIADNADVVVIVWDGKSNGTRHMVEYCRKHKKPFILYNSEDANIS
jgi:predicted Rossmann fold nucleotide-binding protein DprA/Smf involved in DNA uptake